MNTELYIENYSLDLSKDLSALLNFSIDDVKDFSSRSTTWSKTIILPGTANNNRLFGHIFQIGQINQYDPNQDNVGYNFNAAKSADCIIFQDQIQTFKGVLRLLQINIYKGVMEYEVSVFGKLHGLNNALSGALLEDLDFSAYDHVYNDANIVASWDNPGGSGYYYPLIDYGTYSSNSKHDWDIKTFRPALYVKEYIDKMFAAAGYRYDGNLFSMQRFIKLIVPHSAKVLTKPISNLVEVLTTIQRTYTLPNVVSSTGGILVTYDNIIGTGFSANVGNTIYTYNGTISTNVNLSFRFQGSYAGTFVNGTTLYIWKNGETGTLIGTVPNFGTTDISGNVNFDFSGNIVVNIAPADTIEFRLGKSPFQSGDQLTMQFATFKVVSSGGSGIPVAVSIGDTVQINDAIPKNIRQIDFLVGIVKLYNIYVYEDSIDPNLIHMQPFINFYSTNQNDSLDWSYKLDRNQAYKIKPMSELNAKKYEFKFKTDSDYYNELYRKRYNQGYGDRIYDSQFEFADQTKAFEIVFSATPLVGYGGEEKVYSTIFKQSNNNEETVDSNIRILQSKKITGLTSSWSIKNGATILNTLTRYGYAGHLDDPKNPTDDLNFGATRELFFVLTGGSLSNNQFNVYWSGYMAEITNKDSKLLTGNFYLTPADIAKLDFSKYIYLDGILYRLNSIKNYNASKPSTCTVELLKVNELNFTEATPPDGPPDGNFLLWSNDNTLDWDDLPDNEILWTGGAASPVNYQLFVFGLGSTGNLKIFINAILIVDTSTNPSIGSLSVSGGDVVEVRLSSIPSTRNKNLIVNSDVEGDLYNDTGTTTNKIFSWVDLSGRVYTINSTITI